MYDELNDQMQEVIPVSRAGQKPNFPALLEQKYLNDIKFYVKMFIACGVLLLVFVALK